MLRHAASQLSRASKLAQLSRAPASIFSRGFADAAANKLTLNVVTPTSTLINNQQVDMVTVPGNDGEFGILPNHVPVISTLKPGLLRVVNNNQASNYFVSGGFVLVKNSVAEISAVEAVNMDDIDRDAVQKNLQQANSALSSASNPFDQAKAQIQVEVYTALSLAFESHKA